VGVRETASSTRPFSTKYLWNLSSSGSGSCSKGAICEVTVDKKDGKVAGSRLGGRQLFSLGLLELLDLLWRSLRRIRKPRHALLMRKRWTRPGELFFSASKTPVRAPNWQGSDFLVPQVFAQHASPFLMLSSSSVCMNTVLSNRAATSL
jgi:hypothetical protein